jgi:hypothetical protein
MLNAERFGLGLNIRHFMNLTGWNQSQIAQLMQPYIEEVNLKQLKHSISIVVLRRQRRWKYSSEFAFAFGLPEQALLVEDWRQYETLSSFQRHYSFNRYDVIRRSNVQLAKRWSDTPEKGPLPLLYFRDVRQDKEPS